MRPLILTLLGASTLLGTSWSACATSPRYGSSDFLGDVEGRPDSDPSTTPPDGGDEQCLDSDEAKSVLARIASERAKPERDYVLLQQLKHQLDGLRVWDGYRRRLEQSMDEAGEAGDYDQAAELQNLLRAMEDALEKDWSSGGLFVAAFQGDSAGVAAAIRKSVPLDELLSDGPEATKLPQVKAAEATALHVAAFRGHTEVVELLVAAGATSM